jgi:predicted metal-binding protein
MANVAILYCRRIQGRSCSARAKCYKGMAERNGEFVRYANDQIELVRLTDCGNCPGLTFPRVKLFSQITHTLDRPIDVTRFGACRKPTMELAYRPLGLEGFSFALQEKSG